MSVSVDRESGTLSPGRFTLYSKIRLLSKRQARPGLFYLMVKVHNGSHFENRHLHVDDSLPPPTRGPPHKRSRLPARVPSPRRLRPGDQPADPPLPAFPPSLLTGSTARPDRSTDARDPSPPPPRGWTFVPRCFAWFPNPRQKTPRAETAQPTNAGRTPGSPYSQRPPTVG